MMCRLDQKKMFVEHNLIKQTCKLHPIRSKSQLNDFQNLRHSWSKSCWKRLPETILKADFFLQNYIWIKST